MLKISKLLDYGLLVVITVAKNNQAPYSATKISEVTGLNLPTVRKLLNLLNVGNVITSKRGVEGGYILAKDANDITMLDIVKAIENNVSVTECCDMLNNGCSLKECRLHNYWRTVNSKILNMLEQTSVQEILYTEQD